MNLRNILIKKVLGQHGRLFNMYKIRTMYHGSEVSFNEIAKISGQDPLGKFPNDPRITPIGKVLRAYWFDEIPQLYNIWKGDMDIVGVRPRTDGEWEYVIKNYASEEHKNIVLQFKPGLFGVNYSDLSIRDYKDVIEIEEDYCKQKKENPIVTDRKYFDKIMKNIILGGLRSS